ncbi:MFS transporter [Enterovirga sp.]|uniref:MFS transporter n=1 Tax=Enterovirga sp. TaxID=2026350 RepID=UPI0026105352|nr:MFS transporter [Enterovirga sp.]
MSRRSLSLAVGGLTVTQIVGWGTTFHIPAVLSGRLARGIGLPGELIFGGITLMLVVAAAIAPAVGRALDRDGARRWMVTGSVLAALGLALLAAAEGPILFAAAWVVFGAVMPLALNQSASTALVQISPASARRAIALLLLLTGLSSTIAWPVLISLDAAFGWRVTLLILAAVHLFVCAPLHLLCLPAGRVLTEAAPLAPRPDGEPGPGAPAPIPGAFALAAVAFSLSGMLTWGLPLHMVGLLQAYGHAETAAVAIGALVGPGQVLARAFEMLGGSRIGILEVGVGAALLMPVALGVLLLWGASPLGALVFSIGYGLSAGLISIVRAVAPLRLFGAAAYAAMLGRLNVPQNIAFAAAPLGFAVILERFGAAALTGLALAVALVCLGTMWRLARRAAAQAG